MSGPAQFPYVQLHPAFGAAGYAPLAPVTLLLRGVVVHDHALVDSGATVNVLPYTMGLSLGGNWNAFPGSIPLSGVLGNYPAKPLILEVAVGHFTPVPMAFAWSQSPHARLILGQVNYFELFDVCFHRKRGTFEIQPASP